MKHGSGITTIRGSHFRFESHLVPLGHKADNNSSIDSPEIQAPGPQHPGPRTAERRARWNARPARRPAAPPKAAAACQAGGFSRSRVPECGGFPFGAFCQLFCQLVGFPFKLLAGEQKATEFLLNSLETHQENKTLEKRCSRNMGMNLNSGPLVDKIR